MGVYTCIYMGVLLSFAIQSVMDRHLEVVPVREELDVVFAVVKEGVGVVGDLLQSGTAALHKLHTGEDVREDGIAAFGRDHIVHFFVDDFAGHHTAGRSDFETVVVDIDAYFGAEASVLMP